jgi:hypothetical protein
MLTETSETIYSPSITKQAAERRDVAAAWTAMRDLKLADMTWD